MSRRASRRSNSVEVAVQDPRGFSSVLGFDEGARPSQDMAAPFVELTVRTETLTAAYQRSDLSAQQFAERLTGLVVVDESGSHWTLGASTGRWFTRPHQSAPWEAASAPTGTSGHMVAGGAKPAWSSDMTASEAAASTLLEANPRRPHFEPQAAKTQAVGPRSLVTDLFATYVEEQQDSSSGTVLALDADDADDDLFE